MAMAPSAADTELTAGVARRRKRTRLRKTLENASLWRGLFALVMFVLLWELGARMKDLTGITLPFVGFLPPPSAVAKAWLNVIPKLGYWESWYQSFARVLSGFLLAQVIGIPFGLYLAILASPSARVVASARRSWTSDAASGGRRRETRAAGNPPSEATCAWNGPGPSISACS